MFDNFWVSVDTDFDHVMRLNARGNPAVFCSVYFVELHEAEAAAAKVTRKAVAYRSASKNVKDLYLSGLVTSIASRLLRYPEHFGVLQVKVPQTLLDRAYDYHAISFCFVIFSVVSLCTVQTFRSSVSRHPLAVCNLFLSQLLLDA